MGGLTCFKAYDVRGRVGRDLDEGIVRRIAQAFVMVNGAGRVVLSRDARLSSDALAGAVAEGLVAAGCEVLDLGLAGTEEMYFATAREGAVGGICVTASHNPAEWNGMKLAGRGAAPLAPERFAALRRAAEAGDGVRQAGGAMRDARGLRGAYVAHVAGMVAAAELPPLRIVVNAGHGAAGPTFDALAEELARRGAGLLFRRIQHLPDGRFPAGVPNPLLPGNRQATAEAVRAEGADMGVAFDGDFDRCFLFDAAGDFVDGEHVMALLAEALLARAAGAAVVYDPRVVLAIRAAIARGGGRGVMAPTGHVHMKAAMRESGAVYGGEMSGHHYFRDFFACDSGMIPWLMVAELLGRRGGSLRDLVAEGRRRFPSSGEINFTVADGSAAMMRVRAHFAARAVEEDATDGMSLGFGDWRLNLRLSNTESYLRLNVEAEGRPDLVAEGVAEVRRALGV